ncbi:DUF4253 domain-containing protein [Micromonospora inaquosa]|uniref:DUF4253 domain-containing protein n=1 Tax=Micromonospora inaquosa TaxID=2203716 RepID=UPI0033EF1212
MSKRRSWAHRWPGPSESELRAFAEAAAASAPWLTYRHYSEDQQVDQAEIEYHARGTTRVDLHAQVLDRVRFVTQTDYWYTPDSVLLMLVPTSDVRSSAYWVDFYGALTCEAQQKLAEVLAQWRHRWDARLVASWGTMLQFQVGRRPTPGDEAWAAAGQLKALAPNLDLRRWEVAVALAAGDAWFVHNRP